MDLNALIAELKERIEYAKENDYDMDRASFGYEEGMVISFNHVQMLVDAIEKPLTLGGITTLTVGKPLQFSMTNSSKNANIYEDLKPFIKTGRNQLIKLADQLALMIQKKNGHWMYFTGDKWYSMGKNNTQAAAFLRKLLEPVDLWHRWTFTTKSVNDYRPIIFNPCYPWWCTGYGLADDLESKTAGIVAYLPATENLTAYWPDAENIDCTDRTEIKFSDRFPKPEYFIPKS